MKKLFIILFSVFALTAFAQQKQKLAVYVIGNQTNENGMLGDQLVAAFTESGEYIAVERTAGFLQELKKEQDPMRANLDDNELSQIGKRFGVQLVCVAKIMDMGEGNQKYLSARLIDVETADVIKTYSQTCEIKSLVQFLPEAQKFAKELTGLAKKDREAAELEEQAKAEQKRISDSIAQSKQPKTIDTYKMLSEAYVKGYIIVDQLQVATTYSYMNWDDALVVAKECRIGGFSDWRLPTVSELRNIRGVCWNFRRDWSDKARVDEIKGVAEEIIESISSLVGSGFRYWTASGKVLCNTTYQKCSKFKKCRVLLVRDTKELK